MGKVIAAVFFTLVLRGASAPWRYTPWGPWHTTSTTTLVNSSEEVGWGFFRWGVSPPESLKDGSPAHSESQGYRTFGRLHAWLVITINFGVSVATYACSAADALTCFAYEIPGNLSAVMKWTYWALVAATVYVVLLILRYVIIYLVLPFSHLVGEI